MKLRTTFTCLFFICTLVSFAQEDKHKSKAQEIEDLKSQIRIKDQKITELTRELEDIKASSAKMSANGKNSEGIVFKVQVGTFKNKDLSKYFDNNKNFSGDVDEDGSKKYTLGHFTDYWEADNFKKYIREMGVNDAWIVAYKEGKRVNIKDVLEGNIK